jgi:hypothetical protein
LDLEEPEKNPQHRKDQRRNNRWQDIGLIGSQFQEIPASGLTINRKMSNCLNQVIKRPKRIRNQTGQQNVPRKAKDKETKLFRVRDRKRIR